MSDIRESLKMYINRTIKPLLISVAILFMVGCNVLEQPRVNLVMVETTQNAGKTTLQFHCVGASDCYAPILIPVNTEWIPEVEFDREGNLLIPFRIQIRGKYNSVGYIQASKTSQKTITGLFPDSKRFDYLIYQIIFFKNKMVFTIEGDDHIYILDESGQIKEILIADMDPDTSHYKIEKGLKGEIIVVGRSLKKQNNSHLINISSINLQEFTVETRLIPWPESVVFDHPVERLPGKKYDILVDGVTSDQKLLYYQFVGLNNKMQVAKQLGVYDTQTGNDRTYQFVEECIGLLPFSEYKGYLYKNGQKSDLGVSDKPVILDLSDFRSIIDFKELEANPKVVRIVPFGNSFLIGLDQKIVQVDFSGKILQEFSVPSDLVGKDYLLARFEN